VNEHLVEKFLAGTATAEEAETVLDWFGTEEGQKWLAGRFDQDVQETFRNRDDLSLLSPETTRAERDNHSENPMFSMESRQPLPFRSSTPNWVVAAAVILLAAALSLVHFFYTDQAVPDDFQTFITYSTMDDEHRMFTLTDGTRVRLNENSTIEIPESWSSEHRKVTLQGEAFFEVTADSLRPFIIQSEGAYVHVLGTAFNVKTTTRSGEMIVAVSEGRVSLGSSETLPEDFTVLDKNMLGLLNYTTREVVTETADVTNYINWMHGRVVYHSVPFAEVVRQLGRIYDIQNEIADEELHELKLTADFSERSLNNVLETIAHSLDIEVRRDEDRVTWKTIE